jgi:hypothetical protein
MARITCKIASSGKALNATLANVGTSFATIVEAPDFSLPDPNVDYAARDPLDAGRAIRPGEVAMVTPLFARNKTGTARWIEVRLLTEGGTAIEAPGRVIVPANETALIPVQGRSLVKRVAAGANGDRLQVRAEAAATFDVWTTAEERLSAEHIGVIP